MGLRHLLGVSLAVLLAAPAMADSELTVYTAVAPEDRDTLAAAFNAHHPDIEIKWVGNSTGVMTAKLLAEKDNPQADVVWGLAATSLLTLKAEGMLMPYAAAGVDALDPRFVDRSSPPSWVGMDGWLGAVCINTVEAEAAGLPTPATWADLTDPVYAGHIVMPNPASSGTGFLNVASWITTLGEEDAWKFMDGFHANIMHYTHSGSAPCREVAAGEATIGIGPMARVAKLKSQGAPVEIIVPEEGIGWDMEAAAIINGTDNLEGAQALIDFAISEEAMGIYNRRYAVVAIPEIAKPVENFPDHAVPSMVPVDFEWAANERGRLLEIWTGRYDGKSLPKN